MGALTSEAMAEDAEDDADDSSTSLWEFFCSY
jgi:hypothetical protein